MFSRRTLGYLNKQGYISFNEDESYLDEIIGWAVAALGVYFQVTRFFNVPFPLNIFMFPLSFLDETLKWVISN